MNARRKELTAAQAGLSGQRQIEIALRVMCENGGSASMEDIYAAVEQEMRGAILSRQGRDTLRSLINRDAVRRGLVYPYEAGQDGWRITPHGKDLIAEARSGLEESDMEEEIEGLDENRFDLGEYPIDSLLIRSETRTVFEVARRIDREQYVLNPEFQRDFIWDEIKQSKLIESALMRIPLPVFYLAENPDGRVVVVDGLQRLSTFHRFLRNELKLRGLKGNSEQLNGLRFKDLPAKLQNRLEDTQLILYLIDAKVPDRARLDIFERVNSGVALSRQQMRNCLYVGDATIWLREQALSEAFRQATGGGLKPKMMRDREAINRFCGFYLFGTDGYQECKGDIDEFLGRALTRMNEMGKSRLDQELTPVFERSMRNNYQVFENQSFRKPKRADGVRSVINIALFDVYSVLMTRFSEQFVVAHRKGFRQRFYALQADADFVNAITISTNDVRNVLTRFAKVTAAHADLREE